MAAPILITVTLYAFLRESAEVEEISLELPPESTLRDVWPKLVEMYPIIAPMGSSVAWAINHSYARLDQPLMTGDAVAALPPISGG